MLYNRASADPDGAPWSERKRYVWWDEASQRWTGEDVLDFQLDKPPNFTPEPDAVAEDALSGSSPFILQSDGKAWLFAPSGLADGPLPTFYEPNESPVRNPINRQQDNPATDRIRAVENPDNRSPRADDEADPYPFALTTYRLTEHHTAGAMSRVVDRLNELQPEMFCEVSPQLAALRHLENGGWASIITSRAVIEARVLVTARITPLDVGGRVVHTVGLPFYWGSRGATTGDSANDLLGLALDPNVHIQNTKAQTCDMPSGRRPEGRDRLDLVERHRQGTVGR